MAVGLVGEVVETVHQRDLHAAVEIDGRRAVFARMGDRIIVVETEIALVDLAVLRQNDRTSVPLESIDRNEAFGSLSADEFGVDVDRLGQRGLIEADASAALQDLPFIGDVQAVVSHQPDLPRVRTELPFVHLAVNVADQFARRRGIDEIDVAQQRFAAVVGENEPPLGERGGDRQGENRTVTDLTVGIEDRKAARMPSDRQRVDRQDAIRGDRLPVDVPFVTQAAFRHPVVNDPVTGLDDDLLVVAPAQADRLHRIQTVDDDVVAGRGVIVISLILVATGCQGRTCEQCGEIYAK